jgi:hypothetical protein
MRKRTAMRVTSCIAYRSKRTETGFEVAHYFDIDNTRESPCSASVNLSALLSILKASHSKLQV